MIPRPRVACLAVLLCLAQATVAAAEQFALLIGIGSYPRPIQKLDGPRHDVEALRDELTRRWGFPPSRVTALIDGEATQQAILSRIDRLIDVTRPGDDVFIYYSGHGTSAFDEDLVFQGTELGKWTGALIPYDYPLDLEPGGDAAKWAERLIIGRRDLRHRFRQLDRGRDVFVVFDTCFSGSSVRSISRRRVRWVDPVAPVRSPRSISRLQDPFDDEPIFGTATASEEDYPYSRLIYLSAARRYERAEDLPAWETVDGRPHGALTNALLKGLQGAADADRDARLSYAELYRYVHDEVSEKNQHMPQLLYPPARPDLVERTLFGQPLETEPTAPEVDRYSRLRVRVGAGLQHLRRQIEALPRVQVVTAGAYHISIERQADGRLAVVHASGDHIAGGYRERSPQLLERISRQVQIQALIDLSYPRQDVDLTLELSDGGGFLYHDQRFDIAARAERPSFLLLLNIDKSGAVTVLYPIRGSEVAPTTGLRETFEVVAPYGTEYLKLFAFRRAPPGLQNWRGRKLDALAPEFEELLKLLRDPATARAQTRLKIVTVGALVGQGPER